MKKQSLSIPMCVYGIYSENYMCIIHVSLAYCDRMKTATDSAYRFRAHGMLSCKKYEKGTVIYGGN